MFCRKCGQEVYSEYKFCPKCGTENIVAIESTASDKKSINTNSKNKISNNNVIRILAIMLGISLVLLFWIIGMYVFM